MPNTDRRSKINLDDLLHLKRAERPPADFWNRFEGELRQKQLAALLDRRPWWQGFSHFVLRRAYLPVGATAVVVLTLAGVKYYSVGQAGRTFEPVGVVSHAAHLRTTAPSARTVAAADNADAEPAVAAVRTVASLSDRLPDGAADLTPWSAPRTVETPSAKFIAASMARLERNEPDLANSAFGGTLPAANTGVQAGGGSPMVEFAAVATVASKRGRLLAELDDRRFSPEPQAPDIVRERLARRLGDADFNDSFSRIALKDGGVSLKF